MVRTVPPSISRSDASVSGGEGGSGADGGRSGKRRRRGPLLISSAMRTRPGRAAQSQTKVLCGASSHRPWSSATSTPTCAVKGRAPERLVRRICRPLSAAEAARTALTSSLIQAWTFSLRKASSTPARKNSSKSSTKASPRQSTAQMRAAGPRFLWLLPGPCGVPGPVSAAPEPTAPDEPDPALEPSAVASVCAGCVDALVIRRTALCSRRFVWGDRRPLVAGVWPRPAAAARWA